MSYTVCSVCGNQVGTEKNILVEHKDKRGHICYGSFTPVQNFDPFYVKRTTPLGDIQSGSLDALVHNLNDDEFMNALRVMN